MDFQQIFDLYSAWIKELSQNTEVVIDPAYFAALQDSEAQIAATTPMQMNYLRGETFTAELGVLSEDSIHVLYIYALANIGVITPQTGTSSAEIMQMMGGHFGESARKFVPSGGFRTGPLHFLQELEQMLEQLPTDVKVKSWFGYDEDRQAMSLKLGMNVFNTDGTITLMNLWVEYRAPQIASLGFYEVSLDAEGKILIQSIQPYFGELPKQDPRQN